VIRTALKYNVLATYVSQIYATLVGIAMVPMYVQYMGAESYGLVGFYAMLQAWFQVLDMGLTPTMSREVARYRGGAADALTLRRLLRALEGMFLGFAVLGGAGVMAASGVISSNWLKVQQLPLKEVEHAVALMGGIVALRWISGLYRGAITGFERLVWLSGFNIAVTTARFVLVIPFLVFVSSAPTSFFGYQLALAVLEIAVLALQTYRLLPVVEGKQRIAWRWQPIRDVLKFSMSISFASAVWLLATQIDKLILSKLLPLADFAYFTLAVLLASGVTLMSNPFSGALLPRLTKLNASGDEAGVIRLYRDATQLVGVVAIPTALILAFFAEQVLWSWTGDAEIARKAAPVLTLYALGNCVLALAAFPYYLQFAKGDLRLHLIGNAFFVVTFIPLLLWATTRYGAVGAGFAWIIANLVPFMFWLPIVHRRFVTGLHRTWLLRDVCTILVPTMAVAALGHRLMQWPEARINVAIWIGFSGLALFATAAAGSAWVRRLVGATWNNRRIL
jgi:O-antigen/teichoic acid export membrane protein